MNFPYHHVRRGDVIRYLPLVKVTVHGADDTTDLLALIDSGADENVLRKDVADELGLSLDQAEPVTVTGYDGTTADAFRLPVDLQIGSHRWRVPVIFSDAVTRRGLLGQAGLFKFATVTFRYWQREMEITWRGRT